jgi:hypothetical protein
MAKGFIAEPLQIDLAPGAVVERTVEFESGFQISGRCVDEQAFRSPASSRSADADGR